MYVLLIVVCPFVLFLLAIVLSVLLRYTDFDYLFSIFKLILYNKKNRYFYVKLLLSRTLDLLCFFVALASRLALNALHSLAVAIQAHQLSSGRFFF